MEEFLSGTNKSQRDADNLKYLAGLQKRVEAINALESEIEELEDEDLSAKTAEFKKRLQQEDEDIFGPLVEEAFAVVREAAWYV